MGYTFLMKPFGMEYNLETLQCTSSGQDKVLGGGAIELRLTTHKVCIDGDGHTETSLVGRAQENHPTTEEACLTSLAIDTDHHYHQGGGWCFCIIG